MSNLIKHVTDGTFEEEVLKSPVPVLVDYWAEWCGPCKSIAPILEDVAEAYEGRLTVAKVDVDTNNQISAKYGIRGIPTLMIFKGGTVRATKVGALAKPQLVSFVEANI